MAEDHLQTIFSGWLNDSDQGLEWEEGAFYVWAIARAPCRGLFDFGETMAGLREESQAALSARLNHWALLKGGQVQYLCRDTVSSDTRKVKQVVDCVKWCIISRNYAKIHKNILLLMFIITKWQVSRMISQRDTTEIPTWVQCGCWLWVPSCWPEQKSLNIYSFWYTHESRTVNISVKLRKKGTGCTWWEGLWHPVIRSFLGGIDSCPSRTTQCLEFISRLVPVLYFL